jgi:hypothetical protein
MGILKKLSELFQGKKHHNQRSFVEILRTLDHEYAMEVKAKIEKYKIPVYVIDHAMSKDNSSGKTILRVSEKYLDKVNKILNE